MKVTSSLKSAAVSLQEPRASFVDNLPLPTPLPPECDYLYGWTKKCHKRKNLTKNSEPQRYSWEHRRRRRRRAAAATALVCDCVTTLCNPLHYHSCSYLIVAGEPEARGLVVFVVGDVKVVGPGLQDPHLPTGPSFSCCI